MSIPLPSAEELHAELLSYKQAVHQLSFQLEMLKDKQAMPVAPHRTVMTIRKHALKQAAEFVMDWGVPKSGGNLVELCKQIKELPETRATGVGRALDEMDIAFKEKP